MRQAADVTVLIVDDDADVTTYLATILEDAGIRTITAHDGNGALERIREAPPDLISLDLVMPGKSGIRLLHELRKHSEWSHIPVLIVTGHARDEAIRHDLQAVLSQSTISGPSLYLEKPVTPEKYLEHVCRTLGVALPAGSPAKAAAAQTRPASAAEDLRREAEDLLRDADAIELTEVLRLLRARRTPVGGA